MTARWDATGYDADFSFVTAYGADLLGLLDAHAGERVLDVGCGTGHQAALLAGTGAAVVGVDADEAMLEVARAEHPGPTFLRVDAQDVDAVREMVAATGGAYDAVLSNAALHWMPRQDDVVAGLALALRPGGRLVVEMGGVGNVARITGAIRDARRAIGVDPDVAQSWTFPTPAQMAARLEAHGFTVRLLQLFDRRTPLAAGSTGADWARMFGAALVDDVPPQDRVLFDTEVDAAARERGLDEGGWWIDYVRLRVVAERR
jgi:trans-aconitate methyltransferase